jgi:hypothetical protein
MFHLFFHNLAVKLLLTVVTVTPIQSDFPSTAPSHSFSFGLRVPQQFMAFLYKSSDESGEEKKLVHAEFMFVILNP